MPTQTEPAKTALLATREVRIADDKLLMLAYSNERYRLALFAIVKDKGKPKIVRQAADDSELAVALANATRGIADAVEIRTVERYIRETNWGADLP